MTSTTILTLVIVLILAYGVALGYAARVIVEEISWLA